MCNSQKNWYRSDFFLAKAVAHNLLPGLLPFQLVFLTICIVEPYSSAANKPSGSCVQSVP